jgi:type II secretory pathway pseudopilin PulG
MDSVKCGNCEWANRPGVGVCERCGAPLQSSAGAPQEPSYYYPPPPSPLPKKGMSKGVIAAIVVGVILLLSIPVIGIVAAIAIPSLLAARRASNESAAIGNLRTIGSAEATYLSITGRSGTFAELRETQMLDEEWADGVVRDGYRFRLVSIGKDAGTFEFSAEPATPSDGSKSFNITEDDIIRFSPGATAPKGRSGKELGT